MGIADRLKRTFNDEEDDEAGIITQVSNATTLGWGTRIKGFIICFVIGIILSVIGSISLWFDVTAFAIIYSLGTIVSLCSTCFLMGPCKQLKKMVDPTRIICTIVLVVCIVLTFIMAIVVKSKIAALIFVVLQSLALLWYSISYIPFARDAVVKGCKSCCNI